MDTQLENASFSRIAKRIGTKAFWLGWLRRPGLDLAESVIRLRRLRGLNQTELAKKMRTKQPAIARIESGDANVRLETLVELAQALNTTVRLDLIPIEFLGSLQSPRWWEVSELLTAARGTGFTASTEFRLDQPQDSGLSVGDPSGALQLVNPQLKIVSTLEDAADENSALSA
jgi:transcriptional regulator with XRE-family HTH domain